MTDYTDKQTRQDQNTGEFRGMFQSDRPSRVRYFQDIVPTPQSGYADVVQDKPEPNQQEPNTGRGL